MSHVLTPAQRLIVAADFKPTGHNGRKWVKEQVLALAKALQGTGVYLKLNSGLRACGYDLIDEIHHLGLLVFADLKLCDISETLATDGVLLREARPDLLTVMCSAGLASVSALKAELPNVEVLGVTVLTSLAEPDAKLIHGLPINEAVLMLTRLAVSAGLDGIISSAVHAPMVRVEIGDVMTINTPAIRPKWTVIEGRDDQNPNAIMTPYKAINAGANRIVIGRPIIQAKDPREAVLKTISEIELAMAEY